jgi:hypothetical protein
MCDTLHGVTKHGKHAPGYHRAYHAARSRSATWVGQNLPSVLLAARGYDVDIDDIRADLQAALDNPDLALPKTGESE